MTVRLRSAGPLRGEIRVPGDKSISHRAVILNGLAAGRSRVEGFLPSQDCLRSIAAMEALGVTVEGQGAPAADGGFTLTVVSPGRRALHEAAGPIDCGNSGTTIRLLAGVGAGLDGLTILDGDESLRRRPMDRVLSPLRAMGARVDGRCNGALAPISVRGGALRPFQGVLKVASAQVKSAILLAALGADGPSAVEEIGPTRDHTETMLRAMGVDVRSEGLHHRLVPAERDLEPLDLCVPGDLSAAAFWLVAGTVVPGSEIHLRHVGLNPTRTGVLDVLGAMGADIEVHEERTLSGERVGDLVVRSAALRGTTIAGDLVPRVLDELPVVAVAAASAQGVTEIRDAAELRVKESDRIACTVAGLRALGARVEERPDGLVIEGRSALTGGRVDSAGDHRLAMAFAVAALGASGEAEIRGAESVGISYPMFWEHLRRLNGAALIA